MSSSEELPKVMVVAFVSLAYILTSQVGLFQLPSPLTLTMVIGSAATVMVLPTATSISERYAPLPDSIELIARKSASTATKTSVVFFVVSSSKRFSAQ